MTAALRAIQIVTHPYATKIWDMRSGDIRAMMEVAVEAELEVSADCDLCETASSCSEVSSAFELLRRDATHRGKSWLSLADIQD
mmetsp:Transcript_2625/g.2927  ORF Transcript_2625/g.2927 Transcript_2625/m.2927 type:complete len:84 (-) Transcript_2625:212-463(-)